MKMEAFNVFFCNKVKVLLDLDKSPYFRVKDVVRVFGGLQPIGNSPNAKLKRITVPLRYKIKCTQLNVKGSDFYVNVRGFRRILLKLKIENSEEVEEFFFETCVKIKLDMTENLKTIYSAISSISAISMDENSILDYEDAIAEEKLEKKRKPRVYKSKTAAVKKQPKEPKEPKKSPKTTKNKVEKPKAEKPNTKAKPKEQEVIEEKEPETDIDTNDQDNVEQQREQDQRQNESKPAEEPEPEIDTEDEDEDTDDEEQCTQKLKEPKEPKEHKELKKHEEPKEPESLFVLLEKRKNVFYVRKTNVEKKKKIIEQEIPIMYESKNDLTAFVKKVVKNLSKHGDKVVCDFDESTYTIKIRAPLDSDKLVKEFIKYDNSNKNKK